MARVWNLRLSEEGGSTKSLVARVVQSIADDIRRERLQPGDELPGARALARAAGVGRNTVVAAYRELAAEGWISVRPREVPVVTKDLPRASRSSIARARRVATDVPFSFRAASVDTFSPTGRPKGLLDLGGGIPDVRLLPRMDVSRALRRALHGRESREALSYGDARGHRRLRAAVAAMLRERRALAINEDRILITRGSQMAIALVARAVLGAGKRIAIEDPGYRAAWAAFAAEGASLVPLPVDRDGMRVDALAAARVDAVYTTPHHQYPTMATLSASRRLQLLQLAPTRGLCVIEDDFDYELAYEGRPVLPLASADEHGSVVYVGTLSKVLAPGLRIGYVVAPESFVATLARHRVAVDRQGDHVTELAIAELLEDGVIERSIRRCRRIYRDRRDALVEALHRQLGDRLRFRVPTGGMSLYAGVHGLKGTVSAWARRAQEEGVLFFPGRAFEFRESETAHARFGFAALDVLEIRDAVQRIAKVFRSR